VLERLFIQAQELFRVLFYLEGYKFVGTLMLRALLPYRKRTLFGKEVKVLR
jgi:hypothetical protein